MRNWVHFLGGSVTVYLLMAACSAGSKRMGGGGNGIGDDEPSASAGTATSNGGAQATGGDSVANAGTSAPNGASGHRTGASSSGGTIGDVIDDMMDPVDDADAAPATSGTRLRARYYVGEDGSKQFIGWHDKERDEYCAFQKAEDGTLRCMPSVGLYGLTYFADDACATQPLTISAKSAACGGAPLPAAALYVSETCGINRVRYEVGQAPMTVSAVYQKSGTACTAFPASLLELYSFFPLTSPTPAPASAFVAGAEQVE